MSNEPHPLPPSPLRSEGESHTPPATQSVAQQIGGTSGSRTPLSTEWRGGGGEVLRRDLLILGGVALIVGTVLAALLQNPGYTDAFYYFNAGQRLAQGRGLTDAALWTYIGTDNVQGGLPVPSHLYWMPLPSLIAALGMAISTPTFDGAQIPYVLLYAALVIIGYIAGYRINGTRAAAWFSALLVLFSGYYIRFWTTTSTFTPYGVFGAAALLAMGFGRRDWRLYAGGGACIGLAHLTRADGVLLLPILILVALLQSEKRGRAVIAGIGAYVVVMLPWFVRNIAEVGSVLPSGGFSMAWAREYNDIFNYPPTIPFADLGTLIRIRIDALILNVQTFVVVEGLIVLAPFILIALWKRRRDLFLSGVILYALGLHAAMTLIFPLPGMRGGLFHSSAALLPFWAALGIAGLDDVILWMAKRRRWKPDEARIVFRVGVLAWALFLSVTIAGTISGWNGAAVNYTTLPIPASAVTMINDPSALYHFTGRSAVVLPNTADIAPVLERFAVEYIVIGDAHPDSLRFLWEMRDIPEYLELTYNDSVIRVYRVRY